MRWCPNNLPSVAVNGTGLLVQRGPQIKEKPPLFGFYNPGKKTRIEFGAIEVDMESGDDLNIISRSCQLDVDASRPN